MRWDSLKFQLIYATLLAIFACVVLGSIALHFHLRYKPLKFEETGMASWYGPHFAGKLTASGTIYNPNKLTAANRTLPLGSIVKVINLENGKSVKVKINDRGPYADGRIIDMSTAAAKKLGFINQGTTKVKIIGLREPKKE